VGDLRAQLSVHLPRRPYIERLRNNRALAGALTGITAAVVGVIGNLAVCFAINTRARSCRPLRPP
jgi:chromate transporter